MAKYKCIHNKNVESSLKLGKVYDGEPGGVGIYIPDLGSYLQWRFEEVLDTPAVPASGLPEDPKARKALPICTGVLDYFPDALAAVAEVSRIGNEQHNPGEPLHWARGKSNDQEDALVRHLVDRGKKDTDGARHSAKVAWRALALLQLEIEKERGGK